MERQKTFVPCPCSFLGKRSHQVMGQGEAFRWLLTSRQTAPTRVRSSVLPGLESAQLCPDSWPGKASPEQQQRQDPEGSERVTATWLERREGALKFMGSLPCHPRLFKHYRSIQQGPCPGLEGAARSRVRRSHML
jgi:hypothetical protein